MKHANRLLVISSLSVLGLVSSLYAEPEWQRAAIWCSREDQGSSGVGYKIALANGSDAYDSVLYCQGHNAHAQAAVRAAGRATVNAFLGYVPPAPPDVEWQRAAR